MIKAGKKTLEWEAVKKQLKIAFENAGITTCEVGPVLMNDARYWMQAEKSRHNFFLTWAHGKKRRHLEENELVTLVALCCVDCHNFIEQLPEAEMQAIIEECIRIR